MHRGPLWQFYLATFMVVFAAQRSATAYFELTHDSIGVLGIAWLLQALLGVTVALGIWMGRRWVLLPVVLLGALGVITAFVGGFAGPERSALKAVGGAAASLLLTGALFLLLRAEFRTGETNTERALRSANLPQTRGRRE